MEANPDRMHYMCNSCRYEFSRKKGVNFKHCPYCGRLESFELKSHNYATKILDEVSSY